MESPTVVYLCRRMPRHRCSKLIEDARTKKTAESILLCSICVHMTDVECDGPVRYEQK